MLKLEVIGNLGADAELRSVDGNEFVSFRVCHSSKVVSSQTGEVVENRTWVSCTISGRADSLRPFLKKGQKVFVRGNASLRLFVSSSDGQRHAGLNLRVWELELCGSPVAERPDNNQGGIEQ